MKKTLTTTQREFLTKVKDEEPFTILDYTIAKILINGFYNNEEAKMLNRSIKAWKESKGI